MRQALGCARQGKGSTTSARVLVLRTLSLLEILKNVRYRGAYVRSAPEQSQNTTFTNRENQFESLATFACDVRGMF